MPHKIKVAHADGTQDIEVDSLTVPDLTRQIVRLLYEHPGAEVSVQEISVDEARDFRAMQEIMQRMQSPAQVEEMRRLFESMQGKGGKGT